jgi:hypothetical protein
MGAAEHILLALRARAPSTDVFTTSKRSKCRAHTQGARTRAKKRVLKGASLAARV